MSSRYPAIDVSGLRTESIADRKSKVNVDSFASAFKAGGSFVDFLDTLPEILAGKWLHNVIDKIVYAKQNDKPVVWAMGAHVIKCGLSPIVIDLVKKGIITCIAVNGAGTIHDSEIAIWGKTSEDVVEGMHSGMFGMSEETAAFVNRSATAAKADGLGFGEALGKRLVEMNTEHSENSILANAYRCGVPVTVHVCIGCDIVHMHPNAIGEDIGAASLKDFRILTKAMSELGNGGVLMNVGSAVVLPEVILKGITTLINLGYDMKGMYGVNLDFMQHYRSNQQIVNRVKEIGGDGIALTGHHEIMIPLIAAGVLSKLKA